MSYWGLEIKNKKKWVYVEIQNIQKINIFSCENIAFVQNVMSHIFNE